MKRDVNIFHACECRLLSGLSYRDGNNNDPTSGITNLHIHVHLCLEVMHSSEYIIASLTKVSG